jgi:D-arginine dehydrogenase
MKDYDFLIIGAGIAGATAAYGLAAHGAVAMVERESLPGYHTTGRSAAFYAETYGNSHVRKLTTASKAFLSTPPAGFSTAPLLRKRGALYVARADQTELLETFYAEKGAALPNVSRLIAGEIYSRVPLLRPGYAVAGVFDADCRDIDVSALHQGYLRGAKARGAELLTHAGVVGIRRKGGLWQVTTSLGLLSARVIVNAAGAWCDEIAALAGARPLGLIPKRRTVITFAAPAKLAHNNWPLVLDVADEFYLKPESGRILASPGDATPMPPQDVQPDEMDIATTIDRLERAFDFKIPKIERKWAGLRTFAPDLSPVVGWDGEIEGFFWCAGQAGYGMQTAPAISALVEALATSQPLPAFLQKAGVETSRLSPARFKNPKKRTARKS